MRILIVEDDVALASGMELLLRRTASAVHIAHDGEEGLDLAKREDYDVILLDVRLPDVDGLKVLKNLRSGKIDTPVIFLSGDATLDTRIAALTGGADDYMTKPFHREELLARINAVVRRSKSYSHSRIEAGAGVVLDLDAKTAAVNGQTIGLTSKEYQMLEALALRKGATLSKEALLNHLYGGMDEPEQKIIDVFVCKLRRKLMDATGAHCIKTVWGRGYQLNTAPAALAA
ncbi:MAG: response regulator [Alphaproteobacteria bacterium]|nr:response regulator [Alphaproteobacteria bacterium]